MSQMDYATRFRIRHQEGQTTLDEGDRWSSDEKSWTYILKKKEEKKKGRNLP